MASVFSSASAATNPEVHLKQLNNNVVNILRSTVINGKATENPTEFNQVMEFFGSAEFGNYASKVGGIPAQVTAEAATVLSENYQQFVNELMVKEYKEKVVQIKPHVSLGASARQPRINTETSVPITEVVDAQESFSVVPQFNGVGVTFTLDESKVDPTQLPAVKASVAELNKNIAPILNQSVRAAAHLEGHKNYQKVFDTNFAELFNLDAEGRQEFKDTLPNTQGKPAPTGDSPSPFVSAKAAKANANLPDIPEADGVRQRGGYSEYSDILGKRESSGQYNIENDIGYIGKYQWGSLALQDLGMVTHGIGSSNRKLNGDVWTGKFGINSKEEFLNSPEAQEKVMIEWNKILDKRMKKAGMLEFVGKVVGGVTLTKDGLRAASHLLGASAVAKMLKRGNLAAKQDANGVKALDYIKLFN